MLTEFQWNALLRGIEQDRCVLCVGPNFYGPGAEQSQSERLGTFLRQHADDLGIRVRENGWYHLRTDGDDGAAYEAVRSFYAAEAAGRQTQLDQLAQLKTHLILCLTPDRHVATAFERQGFRYRNDTYVRNEPDRNTDPPTQEIPLIYNLVGNLDQRNSLVLTYDNFFDYMQSTFRGNSMSTLLKDVILSADYFLFLGMPEDDWRMHLFLRILRQHENRKNKYATMPGADKNLQDSWNEQYGIKLINEDIDGFLKELHRKCAEKELLRQPVAQPETAAETGADRLYKLVSRNRIEDCLEQLLAALRGVGAAGRSLMVKTVQLKGRNRTLRENVTLGILGTEQVTLEENQIRHATLELIEQFSETSEKLGIRL